MSPSGPSDTHSTTTQILQSEDLLHLPNRLTGKTVLVTGGTSGLGLEVAKALHATGAVVFISGRCGVEKGQEIARSIYSVVADGKGEDSNEAAVNGSAIKSVGFVPMDLSDLSSVQAGAVQFLHASGNKLNVLICNAGVMSPQTRMTTTQNHELQFGVNHLAHFLLFKLLHPALLSSSSATFASRLVSVSSCAHRSSGLPADGDYDFQTTKYDPGSTYGASKTANTYMANETERRFGKHGLHGLSVHPGIIMETSLVRHMTDDSKKFETQLAEAMPGFSGWVKNTSQGAASIVWAAVAESLEGVGGVYLEDCRIAEPLKEGAQWYEPGRAEWCFDKAAEERLWVDSEGMVKEWL